jgi:hypothetical protein
MGTKIDKKPIEGDQRVHDITKPWRRKFLDCRDIGPTPPINKNGFWKRPQHGILEKELNKDANNRRNGR